MKKSIIALFVFASTLSVSAQFHLEGELNYSVPNEGKFAKTSYFLGGYGFSIEPKYELSDKIQLGVQYQLNTFSVFDLESDWVSTSRNAKIESISGMITYRPSIDRIIHFNLGTGLYFVRGGYTYLDNASNDRVPDGKYKSLGLQLNVDWYSGKWKVGVAYTVLKDAHFITPFNLGFRI